LSQKSKITTNKPNEKKKNKSKNKTKNKQTNKSIKQTNKNPVIPMFIIFADLTRREKQHFIIYF
jgi:hypothetical protein